jgi:hypothetical protein
MIVDGRDDETDFKRIRKSSKGKRRKSKKSKSGRSNSSSSNSSSSSENDVKRDDGEGKKNREKRRKDRVLLALIEKKKKLITQKADVAANLTQNHNLLKTLVETDRKGSEENVAEIKIMEQKIGDHNRRIKELTTKIYKLNTDMVTMRKTMNKSTLTREDLT